MDRGKEMLIVAPTNRSRKFEFISGLLALVTGIIAVGLALFAPLVTVYTEGAQGSQLQHWSQWSVSSGFINYPFGLVTVGISLICVFTIGFGTWMHVIKHAVSGRLALYIATTLLCIEVISSVSPIGYLLFPFSLLVNYLIPCMGFALLACGAAVA